MGGYHGGIGSNSAALSHLGLSISSISDAESDACSKARWNANYQPVRRYFIITRFGVAITRHRKPGHTTIANDLRFNGVRQLVRTIHTEQPSVIYAAIDIASVAFIQTESVDRCFRVKQILGILAPNNFRTIAPHDFQRSVTFVFHVCVLGKSSREGWSAIWSTTSPFSITPEISTIHPQAGAKNLQLSLEDLT